LGVWVAKLGSLLGGRKKERKKERKERERRERDLLAQQNQYYDTYYISQTGISQVSFTLDFGSDNYFAF
jgi:hypothetical protein